MSIPHSPTPPCDCDSCHRATLAADVRRAAAAKQLARADYIPPLPKGRSIELEALVLTGRCTLPDTPPAQVKLVHRAILGLLQAREQEATASRDRLRELLGLEGDA